MALHLALKGGFFFFNSLLFSLFSFYLPLGKGMTLYLNNILCQVWLKLDQWFWRGKLHQFAIPPSPLKNAIGSSIKKKYTIIPYIPGGFVLHSVLKKTNLIEVYLEQVLHLNVWWRLTQWF